MSFPNWLRQSFLVLLTLPIALSLAIGTFPLFTLWLDTNFAEGALNPFILQFSASSATSILSTVGTASMSALTLAYSISLLVYTLAAGNIGPRLIQRFTTDTVTQITAGILGGTFLYSLHAQLYVQPDFIPKLTISGAGFLAVLCVIQLIYFVRRIAMTIFIDNEISEIVGNLEEAIKSHIDHIPQSDEAIPEYESFENHTNTEKSGYLAEFEVQRLCEIAAENDMVFFLKWHSGQFAREGEPIVSSDKPISKELAEKILDEITISASRSVDDKIHFSVRLLVEIALRALSPGVNDTYTAVAVTEGLTRAFGHLAKLEYDVTVSRDKRDNIRVIMAKNNVADMFGMAFHPLRRASSANILMAIALAESYRKLSLNCSDLIGKRIKKHASLLLKEIEKADHLKEDIDQVKGILRL